MLRPQPEGELKRLTASATLHAAMAPQETLEKVRFLPEVEMVCSHTQTKHEGRAHRRSARLSNRNFFHGQPWNLSGNFDDATAERGSFNVWSTPRNLRSVRARITGLAIIFASRMPEHTRHVHSEREIQGQTGLGCQTSAQLQALLTTGTGPMSPFSAS